MRIKRTCLFSFLFIANIAGAQTLQQNIQKAFGHLQQDSQCRYASVSLTVLDAKTGEVVFAANPDMGLAPGSTLKTVTSITAFNVLGKDFQYQTQLGYTGTISADGTLTGDVIIKGGGDPTLGSWRWATTREGVVLNTMVTALKKAGIKKINGRVIGDNGAFKSQGIPDGWIWQDLGTYYGAGIAGLCWRENQFDILLRTGAVGNTIGIAGTNPETNYLQYKSELTNGGAKTGDLAYPYLPAYGSKVMYVRGTYAIDQTKKRIGAAIPDPAYDAALRLSDTLKRIGITISVEPTSSVMLADKGQTVATATKNITTILSPELSKIVYWLNQKSVNLYAEQLLATIASKVGKGVSTNDGVDAMKDFWQLKGIDKRSMNIFDGSGLSPEDRITTSTMARILQSARAAAWFNDFYESLPVYNDMKMKSGSINSVQAYAGFQTHDGRQLCFSIMVNNYYGPGCGIREKMFRVLNELK
ncbi:MULTISPECIES: D-alanyl-D-alanine carboxypeptidase/D-alanyl-D-alanine-endopeptidase [unclassified Mucilaginibacter]|uniref:D-alanyl-D-alanine carboxypeptidase/D-alanyl-D-alanine endopeptidase n=1 Tax=unclassified Mucilaginibacter TaxID=2617802 RepID=UPI002AC94447|nr:MULTISPECIES: D-alanyl-D-alanine carboxypeptidase/D-alanyl-D-alanine-endopeptidase [unclassified Mucilaginibacter]MEB0249351.1 D-alanyl-D-alanine carboxypeptidase/D-alanyl-D-alanine-endopeptidase [Mucilaginibacter sp. 5B2]MEB0260609.1 D-alanyl-D-alanine carboxypeptidase/D-alanyl-D-alanine-endopeptidase [Mucilaginibacter sp. 10I4]MEB0278035.1 D-alanyl-D-alanine carboxypeptidase/D-alanyl-D-alanine-endopeptidase [Mucilaginibacter sp. 10B2]MEB0299611.1 D-alanyl-D-alanine carboxypeptidase/D-alany